MSFSSLPRNSSGALNMVSLHLPCALLPLPKSLNPLFFHQLPSSKNPNLVCRSSPKRSIARLRFSDPRKVTELVGTDAFRGSVGDERRPLPKSEGILGSWTLGIGSEMEWGEVESVLNRMSKWLLVALFSLTVLWKHDAEMMWVLIGSVVNSYLSTTLKKVLNHARPASALRSDPGMPSSHAQSISYAALSAVLSLLHWRGMNVLTMILGIFILWCGSYLSWLRISQQLHTVNQVLVGFALGSTCAGVWFWMWHLFMLRAVLSSDWVSIAVPLGSSLFYVALLIHVTQNWFMDEQ